ncbi:unnamed protein product [Pedinophyceae sp. YPF-701]|nr:unnamed protein product [Pedinophyceae sp. YPF-701]
MAGRRPCILVSNDDGIEAPGLVQMVEVIGRAGFCDVYVSAPDGERSAQSSAITLGRPLTARPCQVPGAVAAYAIDGSPSDSSMLALCSELFAGVAFDACVTGINRGDNAGMHVVYSGTVGAAREAAMKNIPALALSLNNFRGPADYVHAARMLLPLLKAVLGLVPVRGASKDEVRDALSASVINLNFPMLPYDEIKGYCIAYQGLTSLIIDFFEDDEDMGPAETLAGDVSLYQGGGSDASTASHDAGGDAAAKSTNAVVGGNVSSAHGGPRVFKKRWGRLVRDQSVGSDVWAMDGGWVAVTLVGLQSDVTPSRDAYRAAAGGRLWRMDAGGEQAAAEVPPAGNRGVGAESELPFPFMRSHEELAAARYGERRLKVVGALVAAAAAETGKPALSWGPFLS